MNDLNDFIKRVNEASAAILKPNSAIVSLSKYFADIQKAAVQPNPLSIDIGAFQKSIADSVNSARMAIDLAKPVYVDFSQQLKILIDEAGALSKINSDPLKAINLSFDSILKQVEIPSFEGVGKSLLQNNISTIIGDAIKQQNLAIGAFASIVRNNESLDENTRSIFIDKLDRYNEVFDDPVEANLLETEIEALISTSFNLPIDVRELFHDFLTFIKNYNLYIQLLLAIYPIIASFVSPAATPEDIIKSEEKIIYELKTSNTDLSEKIEKLREEFHSQQLSKTEHRTTNQKCKVKFKPFKNSKIITTIPIGYEVEVIEIKQDWVHISFTDINDNFLITGWVMMKYLDKQQ